MFCGDSVILQNYTRKPLVLALHGPPGVGKSYFQWLLAQSLYNVTDSETFRVRRARNELFLRRHEWRSTLLRPLFVTTAYACHAPYIRPLN
eukprot:4286011-Pyramimonas_sp.AAC.4